MTNASPSVEIVDNPARHRFEADLGDGSTAIAEYELRPGRIVFTHTEVPAAHEGKGIGTALIRFGLRSARERGLQIVPLCPFFADYIRAHPSEQDLLDPAWRKRLRL
jgi:uncharacterized protein